MHALRGSWEEIHLMECKIANSLSNKFENVYFDITENVSSFQEKVSI